MWAKFQREGMQEEVGIQLGQDWTNMTNMTNMLLPDKKSGPAIWFARPLFGLSGMPDKLRHIGHYIPMPLMPPMPPGIAGPALSSSGSSETIASVVNIKPAIEAAF